MDDKTRFLSSLTHARSCKDPKHKCRTKGCHKSKRLLDHHKQCRKSECQQCAGLRKAAVLHTGGCELVACKFPFCKNIKHNKSKRLQTNTNTQNLLKNMEKGNASNNLSTVVKEEFKEEVKKEVKAEVKEEFKEEVKEELNGEVKVEVKEEFTEVAN